MKLRTIASICALLFLCPAPGLFAQELPKSLKGSTILYVIDRDGNRDLIEMNLQTGKKTTRVSSMKALETAQFAPDKKTIIFDFEGNRIKTLNLDTGKFSSFKVNAFAPVYSHDGNLVAYSKIVKEGKVDIMIADVKNTGEKEVVDHPALDMFPDWSPDNMELIFSSTRCQPPGEKDGKKEYTGNWDIYSVSIHHKEVKPVIENPERDWMPAWSPYGRRIAFVSNRNDRWDYYVYNVQDKKLTNVTGKFDGVCGKEEIFKPVWSPDGRYLLLSVQFEKDNGDVAVIDLQGNVIKRLTQGKELEFPTDWVR